MWFLMSSAWADPCTDAVDLAAREIPLSGIVAALDDAAWTAADVACLVEHRAPDRVVRLASRRADIPLPADPRARRWTVGLGGAYLPAARLDTETLIGAEIGWSPVPLLTFALRGDAGVTPQPATTTPLIYVIDPPEPVLLEEVVRESGTFTVGFAPVFGTLHWGRKAADLRAFARVGAGVIHTRDDPWFAYQTGADADQRHPTLNAGVGFDVLGPRAVGLRMAGDLTRWVETYNRTAVANRSFGALSAQILLRP